MMRPSKGTFDDLSFSINTNCFPGKTEHYQAMNFAIRKLIPANDDLYQKLEFKTIDGRKCFQVTSCDNIVNTYWKIE